MTINSILTSLGTLTSRPSAFLVLIVYVVLWWIFDPSGLEWHGVATIATWAMTLVIQRAEQRDTQALHAKLDELLRSNRVAANITRIDQQEPEDIEKHRDHAQRDD